MKYRKKPVVIEAFQWTADINQKEDPVWMAEALKNGTARIVRNEGHTDVPPVMFIMTLEGEHMARVGDFIIQGVKGEIYPCKPDIFEMTYEPFGESSTPSTSASGQGE